MSAPDLGVKEIVQERKPRGLQLGFGWFAAKIAVRFTIRFGFQALSKVHEEEEKEKKIKLGEQMAS